MDIGTCQPGNQTDFASKMTVGGNTVYADGTGGDVTCDTKFAFQDWQAKGWDVGSTLSTTLPATATMMQWIAQLLSIQQ
jgi:hypothetical protein